MNFFGKPKPKATQPKDAIIKLRDMLTVLDKKEKHLQSKIDQELRIAKENATKNKRGKSGSGPRVALMALKRKQQYEHEITKINGTMRTLETQVMTIENANVNLEALNAMKAGSDAMKTIHGTINIDKVDTTMDDIREQMDLANEVASAISQPVGFGYDFDEEELTNELEALEQEELDSKLLKATEGAAPLKAISTAPSPAAVASTSKSGAIASSKQPVAAQPAASQDEEYDEELEELKAAMAL